MARRRACPIATDATAIQRLAERLRDEDLATPAGRLALVNLGRSPAFVELYHRARLALYAEIDVTLARLTKTPGPSSQVGEGADG